MLKKLLFKNELEELEELKNDISDAICKVEKLKLKEKVKSVALDLAVQEIAQRTHDSKELVKERVLDRAIEQFNIYGTDDPSTLETTIDDIGI